MDIAIRYFAAAREATQLTEETLAIDAGATIADLTGVLLARHPALAGPLPNLRFAMDEAFVGPETPLTEGATIALIPPVGGG